ncbi:hypothetical protein ES702_04241 [subsurface metagenome]
MFNHRFQVKRETGQQKKTINFAHKAMIRQASGTVLKFSHPARPSLQTMPPRIRQIYRRRRPVSTPTPPPLVIASPRPIHPLPMQAFFDIYMQKQPVKYTVHRRNIVKTITDLVSIIILNYNTLEVLKPCVGSVVAKTTHPFELIVVDNGSRDGSVNWARKNPCVDVVVANKANYGWCKGNNVGIKLARGQIIVLLNSDTIVRTRGWLGKMVEIAKRKTVGTVGAKLLYPNGRIQHIGGGIHKGNPYHPYNKHSANITVAKKNRVVPYVTGACLLIKKSTIKKVGYLDEKFQLGFGDVDYGLRVVTAGLQNIVCCDAVLTHIWAYTQRKTGITLRTGSLGRYYHKWLKRLPKVAKKVKLDWGAPFR